ncbi:hypothetical protein [Anatilimnocola floriformis]|uniref:hypothetical protein n=1 Tax=Anatilimnocola floriformis TaxID=2948575 RepID=UPI0020C582BE|nr:hypothetical protein [Anatilimnocola floriformis]
MKRESRAPLIAAILLLILPPLYVGSYLALVVPDDQFVVRAEMGIRWSGNYGGGGDFAAKFFWPLEKIDRQIRRDRWGPSEPLKASDRR